MTFTGKHDTAPLAVSNIFPNLGEEKIHEAFLRNTYHWPVKGVGNKELNYVLERLKIGFEYKEHREETTIADFLKTKGNFILLTTRKYFEFDKSVKGDYLEVINGKLTIPKDYNPSDRVYYSWELKENTQ